MTIKMDDYGEDLLKELNRRVLALDSKRRSVNDATIGDHVEALAEITSVGKAEIEKIAKELIAEQEQHVAAKDAAQYKFRVPSREYLAYVIAAMFCAITLFALAQVWNSPKTEELPANTSQSSQVTHRHLYVKSHLAQVLSIISVLKVSVAEYYMASGNFPISLADTGFNTQELENSNGIEKVFMTKDGGIGASLAQEFGDDKVVVLQPVASNGGALINWRCHTNVEQQYLGPPKVAICTHDAKVAQS